MCQSAASSADTTAIHPGYVNSTIHLQYPLVKPLLTPADCPPTNSPNAHATDASGPSGETHNLSTVVTASKLSTRNAQSCHAMLLLTQKRCQTRGSANAVLASLPQFPLNQPLLDAQSRKVSRSVANLPSKSSTGMLTDSPPKSTNCQTFSMSKTSTSA